MFLNVELSGAFGLSVNVLGDGGVEALDVVADVGDDEGVATAGLEDVDVLPLFHSGLWNHAMGNQARHYCLRASSGLANGILHQL